MTRFNMENIFYDPNEESPIKIGTSNIIALLLAILTIFILVNMIKFFNLNIFFVSIVASILTIGYVVITTKIFEKIFSK